MKNPEMVEVQSSNVAAVGYAGVTETLFIRFKGKATIYAYQDVPAEVHAELMSSESIGRYYAQHIKKAYLNEKVEPDEAS
ncbi:KTSC domain-containing protein [Paenibacillus sp. CAU 1782]